MHRPPRSRHRRLLLLLPLALAACSTQRTITIDSEPSGARVFVEGEERGTTPLTLPFVYYGDAEVRLEKEGYASVATILVVPSQIDGYPLVDLPFELTVRRRHFTWKGTLEPLAREPSDAAIDEVVRRAADFRERTRREATPASIDRPLRGAAPPPSPDDTPPVVRPTGR